MSEGPDPRSAAGAPSEVGPLGPHETTVVVIGAGTMGHGIAHVCALSGYDTVLVDVDDIRVAAGLSRVKANLNKGVELGKVDAADRDAALMRLSGSSDLVTAVSGAGLVIEAVPEDLELKSDLLRRIGEAAPAGCLVASNTSSLSIAALSESAPDPKRFLGLHFFNPVHILQLVEVVHGPATSADSLAAAVTFARRLGKEPIVVKDSPGFASSRLGIILGLEAMRMVEDGVASAADIDKAMELGYRHPLGPLKLTDLVGLDVRLAIARYMHETTGSERFRPPAILERMVAEGRLGKKSGRGFYDWND